MKRCAVVVPDEERAWVLENGTELAGVSIPSLKRLFEIAVGDAHGTPSTQVVLGENKTVEGGCKPKEEEEHHHHTSVTHLTRTLGHHKDTPALAPFLGKVPKRRCILVEDVPGPVNIIIDDDGDDESVSLSKPAWRMPFAHRNVANSAFEAQEKAVIPILTNEQGHYPSVTKGSAHRENAVAEAGSRFHIVARIIVSDRSFWIPRGEDLKTLHNLFLKSCCQITAPNLTQTTPTVGCFLSIHHPTFVYPCLLREKSRL
jgi:hypothetical protein